MSTTLETPRLRNLAARTQRAPEAYQERCELCAQTIAAEHRHLLDLRSRELRCVCRACTVLFDQRAAGGGMLRLVPCRRWYLPDLELDGTVLDSIPVGLAFLFHDSAQDRMLACYPSPGGPTESAVDAAEWSRMVAANPVLREMEPDVEVLLVNWARGNREQWLAPIDDGYALTGVVRSRWKGLGGGQEVWAAVEQFHADLRRRSRTVPGRGGKQDVPANVDDE